MTSPNLEFDFDFGPDYRSGFLNEAGHTVRGLSQDLGVAHPGVPATKDAAEAAASRLLDELDKEVARFGDYPDVLRLAEKDFTAHALQVPIQFIELQRDYNFYWTRVPLVLKPLDGLPFVRLKCALEFNPGEEARLRPKARMILPDKKFKQLLELNDSLELRIGENFELEAAAPQTVVGKASVEAKAAAKLGFAAGPFTYRLKRAQVDHSPAGSATVFWSLDGAEFFEEDDPTLVVILQVPRDLKQVKIAAALQAYHSFRLLSATLGEAVAYFRDRLRTFFKAGAPVPDTTVWDITHSL